jgi:signal peptidase
MLEKIQEQKWFNITKLVVNIVFYTLIVVLVLFSIANINKKDDYSVPNLFGKGFTTVATPSMEGSNKDSFTEDDLIFLSVVTEKNAERKLKKVEIGDIITFKFFNNDLNQTVLNTHRIVDIIELNGKTVYVTQGDKIAEKYPDDKYNADEGWEDLLAQNKIELVSQDDVRGIYTGKWNGFGKAFKFLQTSNGFLLCVVLPIALFFVIELLLLVLNFMKIKQEKRDKQHALDMERIKQEQQAQLEAEKARIRAEILAEQAQKEKEEENK